MKQASIYLAIMYDRRGVAHEEKKEWAASLIDYSAAAKANPTSPEYPLHQGNACVNLKKYDDAIAAYELAIKLKPDFKDAIDNLALAQKLKKGL